MEIAWSRTEVDGRPAFYGCAGEGPPVVLLHGWGLTHRTYRLALEALARNGAQVWAPAMPGFGGTPELPAAELSLAGYARWVTRFLDAVGLDEPVTLVGHSFGGGVAIKTAHDHPDRVRSLVLINSIGGSAWRESGSVVRSMAERPLWDWGIHFPRDILPLGQIRNVLPVILEDAVPNLIRNPMALWRVGQLARRADLTAELQELKDRGLPVTVLWGEADEIVPRASFDALCTAIGRSGEVVAGNHSWLLSDPDAFGEVMTNVVGVAALARELEEHDAPRRRWRLRPRRLDTVVGARPADEQTA